MKGDFLFLTDPPAIFSLALGPWSRLSPTGREIVAITGAVVLVTSLAMAWAAFIRKRAATPGRQLSSHSSNDSARRADSREGQGAGSESQGRRRRRRRRREHRPRNPTLAETGGLPPPRGENPPAQQP